MAKNYVCDGAELTCKLCTKPQGKLKVTSNTVKLQDKLFATAKDKEKVNLLFEGNCKKSMFQASPCIAVIKPEKWQGVADLIVQDAPALLEDSTIMCSYGGAPIEITNHLQKNAPTQFHPLAAPVISPVSNPTFTHFEWQNSKGNPVEEAGLEAVHTLCIYTQNMLCGETITVHISEKENTAVNNEAKKVAYTGKVDSKGVVRIQLQNTAMPQEKAVVAIEEMYWVDIGGNKIESAEENENINLYVKVSNLAAGEKLQLYLDNNEGERISYTGVVNTEGIVMLNEK